MGWVGGLHGVKQALHGRGGFEEGLEGGPRGGHSGRELKSMYVLSSAGFFT